MRVARAVPTPWDCRNTMMPRDDFLLAPAVADAGDTLGADALDFPEKRGAFVDHGQCALAKSLDDLAGVMLADALDQAGRQVFLDSFGGLWRSGANLIGLELQAVVAVLHPDAVCLDVFAGDGGGEAGDDGDQIATAVGLDAQHREAGVGVVKNDTLDQTAEGVHGRM